MSVRDELHKRVAEANTPSTAIQTAFDAVCISMGEAADESKTSCMLIPLRPMVNDDQFHAVIRRLRAEDIQQSQSGGISECRVRGLARRGKARQGKARQGKARQGKARQGKARQGKVFDSIWRAAR